MDNRGGDVSPLVELLMWDQIAGVKDMKKISRIAFVVVANLTLFSLSLNSSLGQEEPFFNLDFEQSVAFDPHDYSTSYTLEQVLPGWSFSDNFGTSYTGLHLSSLPLNILATEETFFGPRLSGDFFLAMAAGFEINSYSAVDIGIMQTGVVPIGTKSVRLRATSPPVDHFFTPDPFLFPEETIVNPIWFMNLGGERLDLVDLGGGIWGGDIPNDLMGRQAELSIFMETGQPQLDDIGNESFPIVFFDNISFSPVAVPVPEPTFSVLGIGCALGVLTRRRRLSSSI